MIQDMANEPRYTIIIPTFNNNAGLKRCLCALAPQLQEGSGCEVIIVDDSGRVQAEDPGGYGKMPGLKVIRLERNLGASAARNRGIGEARGEILLFLDDDTAPAPGWFQATRKAWESDGGFDGIGGYIAIDPSGNICSKTNAHLSNWFIDVKTRDGGPVFLNTCNAGYRKSSLIRIGSFDEGFTGAAGEDQALNMRLLRSGGRLALNPDALVYHDQELGLVDFVKKHYRYGEAARRVHSAFPEARYLSHGDYLRLYASTLRVMGSPREKAASVLLVTVSHAAILAGYVAGAFRVARSAR